VKDIEQVKAFYVSHFNLTIAEEIRSQWVLLKAGNCEIGLHQIAAQYMDTAGAANETNSKLVFDIDSAIYQVQQQMVKNSIDVTDVKSWDNYPYLLFDGKDPEGNVFQIRQKK
jgi:predicted enzyme related to lactoylglutathione lyase